MLVSHFCSGYCFIRSSDWKCRQPVNILMWFNVHVMNAISVYLQLYRHAAICNCNTIHCWTVGTSL